MEKQLWLKEKNTARPETSQLKRIPDLGLRARTPLHSTIGTVETHLHDGNEGPSVNVEPCVSVLKRVKKHSLTAEWGNHYLPPLIETRVRVKPFVPFFLALPLGSL